MTDTPLPLGHRTWAIPEGSIPGRGSGSEDLQSHETIDLLDTGDRDAAVALTVYLSDREPAGPYRIRVLARRSVHQWLNDLEDPEPIPTDTDHAMVLRSDVPVAVQHSRQESREVANALLNTLAFPVAG